MPEQQLESETVQKQDLQHIEESLQRLWEKARSVSDLLLRLKTENKELRRRIESLESQEHKSTDELQRRVREVEQLRLQLSEAQSNGRNLLSKEEIDALRTRLKELIMKINLRL